jgi:GNAT superfamily N-acetyltransferase
MSDFTISELMIPKDLDGPHGDDFREMVEVRTIIEEDRFGTPELTYSAEELLPGWLDEHEPKRLAVARVGGRQVARGIYETRPEGAADVAWVNVEVLPTHRGKGIGTALAAWIEDLARAEGRTTLHTYSLAKDVPGERVPAPTGFGSLPADDPGVRFLMRRDWTLEQIERSSRLVLPAVGLEEQLAAAVAASGPDYRVHTWVDRTPERWLPDIALLATRMSTDAPTAGLDSGEEVWTVQRVLDAEELQAASPRRQLIAAVEHVPSATLAGYTELSVPPEVERSVGQEDTIVLKEHRGHRLGMLLKLANLDFLQREYPGHPSVTTFNAEENRHMLSVNEAVGFVPVAYEGGWKKVLV